MVDVDLKETFLFQKPKVSFCQGWVKMEPRDDRVCVCTTVLHTSAYFWEGDEVIYKEQGLFLTTLNAQNVKFWKILPKIITKYNFL